MRDIFTTRTIDIPAGGTYYTSICILHPYLHHIIFALPHSSSSHHDCHCHAHIAHLVVALVAAFSVSE